MKMKTVFISFVMVMLIGVSFVLASAAEKPKEEINVILYGAPSADAIIALLPSFEEETGIKVNIEITPHKEIHSKELLDLTSGTANYDVMSMDNPWLQEFVGTGNLLPFTKYIAKEDPEFIKGFIQNIYKSYGEYEGKIYAYPYQIGVQVLFYRKNLFKQFSGEYEKQYGHPLEVPVTFEEYAQIAKFFTKQYNPQVPTTYGVGMAAYRGGPALAEYCMRLWAMGGREFDEAWNVQFNDTIGVKALENIIETGKYAPPGYYTMYFDEMSKQYMSGNTAMIIQWDAFAGEIFDKTKSQVADKTGVAIVPGNQAMLGGWALVINKNSKNPDAAYEFVRWVNSPELAKKFVLIGGLPGRVSVFEDPELLAKFPYLPVALKAYDTARKRTTPYLGGPAIAELEEYQEILGAAVNEALAGQKSPQEALDQAKIDITKMMERAGYYD
jgi:multiple sugar transport system substrate-binding protein